MQCPIRTRARRRLAHAASLLALSVFVACTSSAPPSPQPVNRTVAEPYLVDPLTGYPRRVEDDVVSRLRRLHRALRDGQERAPISDALEILLARDPGLHPATVLRAQTMLVDGRPRDALELLEPVVEELPYYLAAQLVYGRAAEIADEVLAAYGAYHRVEGEHELASLGAARLRSRALEILDNRFADALDRDRLDQAAETLSLLESWAPEDPRIADAGWRLARARGDVSGERTALERLLRLDDERREVLERLAELDLETGRYQLAVSRLERLRQRYPEDPALLDELDRAKFSWRMQNLPPVVHELALSPRLTRADFATLTYWLIPEVRSAGISDPPIASDIIDHERREEIVRVLALRLLAVNETVHRFAPERPITRAGALAAMLVLLGRSAPELACLGQVQPHDLQRSRALVCQIAARCRLLPEEADCLPTAPVSGAEALDFFRILDRLGVS